MKVEVIEMSAFGDNYYRIMVDGKHHKTITSSIPLSYDQQQYIRVGFEETLQWANVSPNNR